MMEFSDRIALVTGASRGLGFATAAALGARGAQVIAVARTTGGLEELDEAIQARGGPRATLVPLDITDDPGLERMGAAIYERWGRVDLWVHTAAHPVALSPTSHVMPKDLDRAWAVTARAFQRLVRVVEPLLQQSPSAAAVIPEEAEQSAKFRGAHGAAKAAQSAMAAVWAEEQAKRIRVLRPALPPLPTALRARWMPGEDQKRLLPLPEAAERLIAALEQAEA